MVVSCFEKYFVVILSLGCVMIVRFVSVWFNVFWLMYGLVMFCYFVIKVVVWRLKKMLRNGSCGI